MTPIEELMAEHQGILAMLDVLEKMAGLAEAGQKPDPEDGAAVVDFIRTFADKCHHGKEEDLLFPALEAAGIPRQGGPVGVMLHEHDVGRSFVKGMDEALGAGAAALFAANARGYVELLRAHIGKEDHVLFKMAARALTPAKLEELSKAFAAVERDKMGPGVHEAYHALIDKLTAKYLG